MAKAKEENVEQAFSIDLPAVLAERLEKLVSEKNEVNKMLDTQIQLLVDGFMSDKEHPDGKVILNIEEKKLVWA